MLVTRSPLSRTCATFAIVVLLGTSSAAATMTPTVAVKFANLWSFQAQSQMLLKDLGYSSDYLFEFHDEEELTVRSVSAHNEVAEGTLRTILDGQPAYVTMRFEGEERFMHVVLNADDLIASWVTSDGKLKGVDMPQGEILRRVELMMSLLTVARTRLGLQHFSHIEDAKITVQADQFDLLALIPGMGSIVRYAIEQPATPTTKETVAVQMGNKLWTITYAKDTLAVVMGVEGAQVSKIYQLGPTVSRDRIFLAAIRLLRRAKAMFGTSAVTRSLP
jgi:hypothetical protein